MDGVLFLWKGRELGSVIRQGGWERHVRSRCRQGGGGLVGVGEFGLWGVLMQRRWGRQWRADGVERAW